MKRIVTQIFILATVLTWIVYDVVVYTLWGTPATISATFWRYSYYCPGIAFAMGVLCGHLFFQMREPTAFSSNEIDLSIKSKDER